MPYVASSHVIWSTSGVRQITLNRPKMIENEVVAAVVVPVQPLWIPAKAFALSARIRDGEPGPAAGALRGSLTEPQTNHRLESFGATHVLQ